MSKSIVRDKSKKFAIRIVRLYKYLTQEKNEFVIAKKLLRSGTSIGANLAEQEFAVSEADYLNKTSISLKECAETAYWLELLYEAHYISLKEYENIQKDCSEIIKILIAIVKNLKTKKLKSDNR